MHILLFDIDGTLLHSGGAGRVAMERSIKRFYGEYRQVNIPVQGRTDLAIISDLLHAHDVEVDSEAISNFYHDYVCELEQAMLECKGKLLPGIVQLLTRLGELENLHMGILTGNGKRAAEIKLRHFNIDHHFCFGGFGELTACRNEIARFSLQAAQDVLLTEPDLDQTWVIGDTIHDVSCARSIGAKVIAVGTGSVDKKELLASKPDVFLNDLTDVATFLQSIGSVPFPNSTTWL